MAEKAVFISRFFYKILEILGAAVATAVSGYLVAHMGGFLPSQTQRRRRRRWWWRRASARFQRAFLPIALASQPATPPQATQSAAAPALPDADRRTAAAATGGDGFGRPPVRKTAKAPPGASPQPRKPGKPETATAATGSKPAARDHRGQMRETAEAKPREAAEAKPREAEDKESVEARVQGGAGQCRRQPPGAN